MARVQDFGSRLPQGVVTFVFTDIEGSTRRAQDLGDAEWADLLAVHDRLLREAFGEAAVVNTEGDAFFLAFEDPVEAVRRAMRAQESLSDLELSTGPPLRVRIGIHTGAALVRGGDYVGAEVHRASRICSAGHGGQTLVSEATEVLVRDALPDGASLRDLGLHRLKDLTAPQRVFSLDAPGARTDFPPLRSLDQVANNLPVQRTALIGREQEIEKVRGLLDRCQLVTLTGMGGTGKTRLALQVAGEHADRGAGGVFFVDLAPLARPEEVAQATAVAVGLQLGGSQPMREQLITALSQRRSLLVLDNCEHLLDACADLADGVLADAPGVRILATSREPLGVDGEQVHRVPSLSLPEPGSDPSTAVEAASVGLFVDRAHGVEDAFDLTADNVDAVVQICRRLDGIPLAIEFAAARVSHLTPADIANRLDSRFRLLTGGHRRVRRQQTLEAALDWSFDLLDEAQQQLLRRLGVFAGSFALGMAERVCSGGAVPEGAVLDLLGSLVDKSLVVAESDGTSVRYRLLETVRSYAEQKLQTAGEAEEHRRRHRDAYLRWIESRSWEEHHVDVALHDALVLELDNLRGALRWSRDEGRRDIVGRMASRMFYLWGPMEGHVEEGLRWLDWALEDDGLDPDLRAACLIARSYAGMTLMSPDWGADARKAVEVGSDALSLLVTGCGLAAVAAATRFGAGGDPDVAEEARAAIREGHRRANRLGADWPWIFLELSGQALGLLGDLEAAERALTEAVERKATPSIDVTCSELSIYRLLLGDAPGALDAVRIALSGPQARPPKYAYVYFAAAWAAATLERFDEAADALDDGVEVVRSRSVFLEPNMAMVFAAAAASEIGRVDDAVRLLGAAGTVGDARASPNPFRSPASWLVYVHTREVLRGALDREAVRQLREEIRDWTSEDALTAVDEVSAALRAAAATPAADESVP